MLFYRESLSGTLANESEESDEILEWARSTYTVPNTIISLVFLPHTFLNLIASTDRVPARAMP